MSPSYSPQSSPTKLYSISASFGIILFVICYDVRIVEYSKSNSQVYNSWHEFRRDKLLATKNRTHRLGIASLLYL